MSLLRFFKKPGGGESSPLLPTPQSSTEKANDEVATLLEKKKRSLQAKVYNKREVYRTVKMCSESNVILPVWHGIRVT